MARLCGVPPSLALRVREGDSAYGDPECWLLFHLKLNHFQQPFSQLDSVVLESVHSVWAKSESPPRGPELRGGSPAGGRGGCGKVTGGIREWG